MRRIFNFLFVSLLVLVLGGGGAAYFFLIKNVPVSGSGGRISALTAPVRIDVDRFGVPTLKGADALDLVRGQGWMVARDRLFQMDLIRRQMGGNLAEIFGLKALPRDEWHRIYGFRVVADKAVTLMSEKNRAIWQAYADGVNAFIKQGPKPWEMKVLSYEPEPWQVRDSFLVVLSMFETLNDPENEPESAYNSLLKAFPGPLVDFLTSETGFLDTPIKKDSESKLLLYPPSAAVFDLNKGAHLETSPVFDPADFAVGSNAWAVSGIHTQSGKPLIAGDPHLALNVPNLWYRMRLEGDGLAVTGLALPGVPGIVIGRNENLAWSFTNSKTDVQDFVDLQLAEGGNGYLYDGKTMVFSTRHESIKVRRNKAYSFDVQETKWGPVIQKDAEKPPRRVRALQWTALDPEPLSLLNPIEFNRASKLQELLTAMSRWGGPVQNLVVATRDNHIAWALVGRIPNRQGFDGRATVFRNSTRTWEGYLKSQELPLVIDPPEGYIVSANQRPLPMGSSGLRFGHNWPSAARAFRIRGLLENRKQLSVEDMRKLQLDILSPTHLWYREQLLQALDSRQNKKESTKSKDEDWFQSIEELIRLWDGGLNVDSAAYPFLKEFRFRVYSYCLGPFLRKIPEAERRDVTELIGRDSVIKSLLEYKPLNLLDPQFKDYGELLRAAALETAKKMVDHSSALGKLRWGNSNRSRIRHPLALALPNFLGSLLNFPVAELPGDSLVVRVSKPNNGASMRMVVDLSEPKNSLFSQPGGQSGHVASVHYKDQFESWVRGEMNPLEPGVARSTETLTP